VYTDCWEWGVNGGGGTIVKEEGMNGDRGSLGGDLGWWGGILLRVRGRTCGSVVVYRAERNIVHCRVGLRNKETGITQKIRGPYVTGHTAALVQSVMEKQKEQDLYRNTHARVWKSREKQKQGTFVRAPQRGDSKARGTCHPKTVLKLFKAPLWKTLDYTEAPLPCVE